MSGLNSVSFKKLKDLYDNLKDEESKIIFRHRLLYSLDGRVIHIYNMLKQLYYKKCLISSELSTKNSLSTFMSNSKNRKEKIILFGTGAYGSDVYNFLLESGFSVFCFCDNSTEKQEKKFYDLPIISPKILIEQHKDSYVIIASQDYEREIYKQLMSLNFDKGQVIISSYFGDIQYFEHKVINPQRGEVFIDVGCCNGKTLLDFSNWCHNDYEKIYAFEPDNIGFQKCKRLIEEHKLENVELINAGAWSNKTILHFDEIGNGTSTICEKGDKFINVISIDEVLNGKKATFIKMDIEGSELEALKGAKNTILRYHPKLAICIYHKPEDILDIPLYIKNLVPNYQLYIRHYTQSPAETVLYAIYK